MYDVNGWRETNGNFDLHESKLPLVSFIEFIRSKLSICFAHVSGLSLATGEW